MNLNKKVFWLFSLIIFIQTFLPINSPKSNLNNIYIFSIRMDHVVHTIMIIIWMVLYKQAYFGKSRSSNGKMIVYIGSGIMLAILTEAIQSIITYRAFSMKDMIANLIGVIICTPLILIPQKPV